MYNFNSGYGQALLMQLASRIPTIGRIFLVLAPGDASEEDFMRCQQIIKPDPNGQIRLFTGTYGLEDAYAAATSNNNDVILMDADGTHEVSTGLTISKNRVHFFGLDGGRRLVQQGTKIQLSGAVDSAFVLKNTGVRNSFENIKVIQSSTHANALTVFQDGGEGTVFKNFSTVFGVVDNLDQTTAHEFLAGSDSATYEDCTFGSDTLLTSAARSVFHIDQVNGFEFKSNRLRRCFFNISSSSSTATFVRLDAVGDILFSNVFEDCTFCASVDSAGGAAIAEAVQTGTSTVKGGLYFARPAVFNVTDFATATSGRNTNVQVVAAVSAAAATEGIKPTA